MQREKKIKYPPEWYVRRHLLRENTTCGRKFSSLFEVKDHTWKSGALVLAYQRTRCNVITLQTYLIGILSIIFCRQRNIPFRIKSASWRVYACAREQATVYYFNFSLSPDVRQGQDILSSTSSASPAATATAAATAASLSIFSRK